MEGTDLEVRSTSAAQAEGEHAGGEIGVARAFGQDQEAAVVDDEGEAAGALAVAPADRSFTGLQMEAGGAEGDEGEPLAVEFGDMAQRLAGEDGVVRIVLFPEQAIKFRPLCSWSRRTTRCRNRSVSCPWLWCVLFGHARRTARCRNRSVSWAGRVIILRQGCRDGGEKRGHFSSPPLSVSRSSVQMTRPCPVICF